MSISERYRQLVDEIQILVRQMGQEPLPEKAMGVVEKAVATLREQMERVGEIPRIRIDDELSPILLTAHNLFDRGRLMLEQEACTTQAEQLWEVQKKLYRLLNDL
ncbi:MAG: hypothetical protein JXR59_08665 [Desulfuromonadaceae bacterium]|nr:hypothetical protein [Desulfuromonadaceae bacterium]